MRRKLVKRLRHLTGLDCGADTALVLDHGSHIFIWLGANRSRDAAPEPQSNGWTRSVVEAAAQGFVAGIAEGRFPVPEVRVAVEVWHFRTDMAHCNPCVCIGRHTVTVVSRNL